jgi:hypothetical protein
MMATLGAARLGRQPEIRNIAIAGILGQVARMEETLRSNLWILCW